MEDERTELNLDAFQQSQTRSRREQADETVKQLAEDFAQYLYLPRLRDSHVLVQAVELGIGMLTWEQDTFAYAERYDDAAGRYQGLRGGELGRVTLEALG